MSIKKLKLALKACSRSPAERDTRARILDTAVQLFGIHGFAAVSIRDIAQEAGVNLAAVNYHFSSKEKLWQEALYHSLQYFAPMIEELERIVKTAQQDGTVPAAEAAFRLMLERFLHELLRPHYEDDAAMLLWEMMRSRQNIDILIKDFFLPPRLLFRQIIQLQWPDADKADLDMWVGSVVGQCVSVRYCLPVTKTFLKWDQVSTEHLNALIQHTVEFCISAIRGTQA